MKKKGGKKALKGKFVFTKKHFPMLKNAKKKYVMPSFRAINRFASPHKYSISLRYGIRKGEETEFKSMPAEALLQKKKNSVGFTFKIIPKSFMDVGGIEHSESYGLDRLLLLTRKSNRNKFFVEKESVVDFKYEYKNRKRNLTGKFKNLQSALIYNDQQLHWRLVVPISKVSANDITTPGGYINHENNHMVFDHSSLDLQESFLGIRMATTGGMFVRVKVNKYEFEFYTIPQVKALIIDCTTKINYSEFKNITSIIRTAFAFITGKYYRDEVFFVSSSDVNFKSINHVAYETELPTMISYTEILNHTLFFGEFKIKDKDYQEANKKHHRLMRVEEFSALCQAMYQNETFHRTVETILAAMENKSPIVQGGLYSVAIEAMTNIIKDKNPKSVKVISDDSAVKALKKDLLEVLKKHKESIEKSDITDAIKILTQKLNQINDAPNSKKLTIPFDTYHLKLNNEDIEAIKNRNKYLHGESPLNPKEIFQLELISLRLHTLISSLVLKYIGYEGHIVNLPVWHHYAKKEEFLKFLQELIIKLAEQEKILKKFEEKKDQKGFVEAFREYQALIEKGVDMGNAIKII